MIVNNYKSLQASHNCISHIQITYERFKKKHDIFKEHFTFFRLYKYISFKVLRIIITTKIEVKESIQYDRISTETLHDRHLCQEAHENRAESSHGIVSVASKFVTIYCL